MEEIDQYGGGRQMRLNSISRRMQEEREKFYSKIIYIVDILC